MNAKKLLIILIVASGTCFQLEPCILVPLALDVNIGAVCRIDSPELSSFPKIIPIEKDAEYSAVVEFVSRLASLRYHGSVRSEGCSEVTGIVGDIGSRTARILHTLSTRANLSLALVSAVAPSSFLPVTDLLLPNLLDMNPLSHYVEALVALLDLLNWTSVGLVSDDSHYHQFSASLLQKELLKNPKRIIPHYLRISEKDNSTESIHTFREYNTDIIIISARKRVACSLIKEAKRFGMIWPKYALIVLDVSFTLEACAEEGTIFLFDMALNASKDFTLSCVPDQRHIVVPNIFIDSLIVLSSLRGSLHNDSIRGIHDRVQVSGGKRQTNISITQIVSSRFSEIGTYRTESKNLTVDESFLVTREKPLGRIRKQELYSVHGELHYILTISAFILVFGFITAVFILYIYFRKEPEIKATSVTVSLCMFLGCYLLISYFLLLIAAIATVDFHCHLFVWLSLYGLPFTLILATLFAKMLRIYLIFSNPYSYKKKLFSDPFLFIYILLLVSPSILILLIWSTFDPFMVYVQEIPSGNIILTHRKCVSQHTIRWSGVLLFYISVLSFSLTCLALRTSKIRQKHFADTKATNAFTFLSNFVALLTLVHWYFFFQVRVNIFVSSSILYVGHGSIALLCQIFLFVPKVFSPLRRALCHKT